MNDVNNNKINEDKSSNIEAVGSDNMNSQQPKFREISSNFIEITEGSSSSRKPEFLKKRNQLTIIAFVFFVPVLFVWMTGLGEQENSYSERIPKITDYAAAARNEFKNCYAVDRMGNSSRYSSISVSCKRVAEKDFSCTGYDSYFQIGFYGNVFCKETYCFANCYLN